MLTTNITISEESSALLILGRQGEHDVRDIVFDLSYLVDSFGEGTATLVHKRAGEEAPYLVDAVQEDDALTWTVDTTDTAFEGFGRCEIRWTVDDALAKTVIYKTRVLKSITTETEIPDPYQSWYDAMLEYLDTKTVTGAVAQTLAAGSEATASISGGVITIGVPTGATGETGPQGIQGIQGDAGNGISSIAKTGTSGNVDTYTITMTDGTTATFTVTNASDLSASGTDGTVTLSV